MGLAFLLTLGLTAAPEPGVAASRDAASAQDPAPEERARRGRKRRSGPPEATFVTLRQPMPDGVTMTGDLYRLPGREREGAERPVVLLLHGLRSSRAEYRFVAPELNALGYHAFAVDLRFGGHGEKLDERTGERYGTPNETAASALQVLKRPMVPDDAEGDVAFAVQWTRRMFPGSPLALMGSSFAGSLALIHAAEHPEQVGAVIALSPAELFQTFDAGERVARLAVPAYVTCGEGPAEERHARRVISRVEHPIETLFPSEAGLVGGSGSRALLVPDARSRARQWVLIERLLSPLRPSARSSR